MPCSHGYSPESDFEDPQLMSLPKGADGTPCAVEYYNATALALSLYHERKIMCPRDANGCILTSCATIAQLQVRLDFETARGNFWKCYGGFPE